MQDDKLSCLLIIVGFQGLFLCLFVLLSRRLSDYNSTIPGVVSMFHNVHTVESNSSQGIWHVFHRICQGLETIDQGQNTAIRRKTQNQKHRLKAKL